MFKKRGSQGQPIPVCLGKGFKTGRWKVHFPSRLLPDPKEEGLCVGTD